MEAVYTEELEKKLVKPSSPTPDHLRVYNLSSFDRLVNFLYAPHIYFYPGSSSSAEEDPVVETERRITLLEKSLSETLNFYTPLAGRFSSTDIVTVDCNDQGVLFIVTKVKTKMNDFIKKVENDYSYMDQLLTPIEVEGEIVDTPLVKIKMSVFECGGLMVGMNIIQILGDGISCTKFMNDWSKFMKQSIPICVSFDGAATFPLDSKSLVKKDVPVPGPTSGFVKRNKIIGKMILFDSSTIARLKDKVLASGCWTFNRPPSKVQIVTAVLWNGLMRAAKEKHGRQRPFMTSLSLNLRGTLDTSNLSDNSFGNFYIPVPLKFIPGETKSELHDLVYLIRDSLGKAVSVCSKASNDDVFAMISKAFIEMQEWAENEDETDAVFGTSLCRFPRYDVDFGWGRPSLVSLPTLRYPVFVLMDTEFGGAGVEVFLNLYEHEIQSSIGHIIDGMHAYLGKKG